MVESIIFKEVNNEYALFEIRDILDQQMVGRIVPVGHTYIIVPEVDLTFKQLTKIRQKVLDLDIAYLEALKKKVGG